jgi:hypothetical protein
MNEKKTPQPDDKQSKRKDAVPDEFRRSQELDGRNDSGPNPEIHDRDLPPQE